jgi:hypothetical protein
VHLSAGRSRTACGGGGGGGACGGETNRTRQGKGIFRNFSFGKSFIIQLFGMNKNVHSEQSSFLIQATVSFKTEKQY